LKPGPVADAVLLGHMLECIARIRECTEGDRNRFLS